MICEWMNVFQQVRDFSYLGTNINHQNNNEIKLRIASGNKGYYALAKMSKIHSRRSKEYLYSSFLRDRFWRMNVKPRR